MLDHSFSLTKVLQLAATKQAEGPDVDEVHALLGLSMPVTVHPACPYPAQWSSYARDACIAPAAEALGVSLRAMHPPEAARGLTGMAEFAQHFEASYRPLIVAALRNGQPVIVWQGFGGEDLLSWGWITGETSGGVGLEGAIWTADHAGQWHSRGPLVLDVAPVQVYVVERVEDVGERRVRDVVAGATRSALAMMGPGVCARFGVLTGSGAMAFWMDELKKRGAGPMAPAQAVGHQQCAAAILRSIKSAARFLKKAQSSCDERLEGPLGSVMAACTMVGHHLMTLADPMTSRQLFSNPRGIDQALRALSEVKLAQINLMAALQSLERALGAEGDAR